MDNAAKQLMKSDIADTANLQSANKALISLLFAYYVFFVYASLVPFTPSGISFDAAIAQFGALSFIQFNIDSIADWTTNYLLLMPAAYFICVLNFSGKIKTTVLVKTLLIFIIWVLTGVLIEFAQLFFEGRVTSAKDVHAQIAGIATAIVIYFATRSRANRLLLLLGSDAITNRWLGLGYTLLFMFCFYSLMPLDLTLDIGLLGEKWRDGRINLIPFIFSSGSLGRHLVGVLVDIAIWTSITMCFLASRKYSASGVLRLLVFTALLLEIAQILVISRYTDTTDIVSAFLGVGFALLLSNRKIGFNSLLNRSPLATFATLAGAWYMLLAIMYGFGQEPINAEYQLSANLANYFKTPFIGYWQDEIFNAMIQLARKTVAFVPFGVLLAWHGIKNRHHPKIVFFLIWIVVLLLVVLLEMLQVLFVNRVASSTDTILNLVGVLGGYLVTRIFLTPPVTGNKSTTPSSPSSEPHFYSAYLPYGLFLGLAGLLYAATNAPQVPYNVKELFLQYPSLISASLFTICLLAIFRLPSTMLSALNQYRKLEHANVLFAWLIYTLIVTGLVYITFPNEALHDIVGSPVWKWLPSFLEFLYRFFFLIAPLSLSLFLFASYRFKTELKKTSVISLGFFYSLLLFMSLPIWFMVVIYQAGTDNLTELMVNEGHSPIVLCIPLAMIMFGIATNIATIWPTQLLTLRLAQWVLVPIAASLAILQLLNWGLASIVVKYDRVFTPLQFLFSPDREQLLTPSKATFVAFLFFTFAILCSRVLALGSSRSGAVLSMLLKFFNEKKRRKRYA